MIEETTATKPEKTKKSTAATTGISINVGMSEPKNKIAFGLPVGQGRHLPINGHVIRF